MNSISTNYPDVIEVLPVQPLALQVKFKDGTTGKVQFTPSHLTGVFEALKNWSIFQQVHIDNGAVTWPGNIDLAPDAMYVHIKTDGIWVLN